MSSRRAFFLWVSVNVKSNRSIRFALPIPLYLLLGLSDIIEDAAFFVPSKHTAERAGELSPYAVKEIMRSSARVLREIALNSEPFDLADIDIADSDRRVVLRCLLK